MSKLIVNYAVDGYETVDIEDIVTEGVEGNEIFIVLDADTSDKIKVYYEKVLNILVSKNKMFLIIVGKESKIRKSICNLMLNYRNYNIYRVDNKGIITAEYLSVISQRSPSIDEIQTFIGGDISGYYDLNIIIMGITDLINRGDLEGLKVFIEEHINSVENLTSVVDYMKKVVDTANSRELMDRICELKEKIGMLDDRVDKYERENQEYRDENIKLVEKDKMSVKELSRLMSRNKELEQQVASNTPIIQTYSEINTALIKCKTTNIIYFKEVSYVKYMNSLITMITKTLSLMKKRFKLIIYDSRTGMANVYKPLSVINGSDFVSNKQNFITNVEAFVVLEPNPTILTSVLESINPVFDVVIVYDRMRQLTNIVTGNNVTRFYVMNSSKDFKELEGQLRITDKSTIITHPGSSIGNETLNIPTIPDYNAKGTTDAAKTNRYLKLQSEGNGKLLISTILDKSHIN